MGQTYARSFLASRFIKPADMYLLSKREIDLAQFGGLTQSNLKLTPGSFIDEADIIIIAVKPQDFPALALTIKEFISPDKLILSIMAGRTIKSIASALGTNKIVRSMPNLPSQIGMGMTVFTASPALDKKDLFIIQNLINTTGKSVYVEDENLVDAATAISGSGPAYVFYFMSAMIQSAKNMGFNQSEAELLVNQTFMGAVHLHSQSQLTCEDWISKVASKGGTTEAAFEVMKNEKVREEIEAALDAACKRAVVLGSN